MSDPVVLFESPRRLAETLRELAELMPERSAAIARELTKVHEEFVRGALRELAPLEREWIGEVTVVLGPYELLRPERPISEDEIDERIDREIAAGQTPKTVAQVVAAWSGRPRREVYQRAVARKQRS